MGNQVGQNQQQKVIFTPDVILLKKSYDARYGEIKQVRDKNTGLTMIVKDVVANTKEGFEKEHAFFTKRVNFSHSNFVKIYGFTTQDQQNFCSTFFKLSVYIEILSTDLEAELRHKMTVTGSKYSESDILLIAENLISGLSYF